MASNADNVYTWWRHHGEFFWKLDGMITGLDGIVVRCTISGPCPGLLIKRHSDGISKIIFHQITFTRIFYKSVWCQAIIWTDAGIFLIGPLDTNFCQIGIKLQHILFKKRHLKLSSAKCRYTQHVYNVSILTKPKDYMFNISYNI